MLDASENALVCSTSNMLVEIPVHSVSLSGLFNSKSVIIVCLTYCIRLVKLKLGCRLHIIKSPSAHTAPLRVQLCHQLCDD